MLIAVVNLSNPKAASIDLSDVQSWQIGKCHKVLCSTGNFYKVENESGKVNDAGEIIEYTVHYDDEKHCFTCTCPAGNPPVDAYGQPLYAPKQCKHIKWSLACEQEVRQAVAEQERYQDSQITEQVHPGTSDIRAYLASCEEHNSRAIESDYITASMHDRQALEQQKDEIMEARKQALQEQEARAYMFVDGKPIDDETYNRVMNAKPQECTARGNLNGPKPFSILR